MLYEMASGNFSILSDISGSNDEIDEISSQLKQTAEQIQKMVLVSGVVKPRFDFQCSFQFSLLLDETYAVKSYSSVVPELFGITDEKVIGMHVGSLITGPLPETWDKIERSIRKHTPFLENHTLYFKGAATIVPAKCIVCTMEGAAGILIISVITMLHDSIYDSPKLSQNRPGRSLAAIISGVRDYICSTSTRNCHQRMNWHECSARMKPV